MKVPEREAELVAAAAVVFAERGYAASAVADITSQAGVSQGTFYHYFANRREVFDRALAEAAGRIVEAVAQVVGRAPVTDVELEPVVAASLARVLELLDEEPGTLRLLCIEAFAVDGAGPVPFLAFADVLERPLSGALRAGQRSGLVRTDLDVVAAAQTIFAYALSAALSGVRGPVTPTRRVQQADRLAALIVRGVAFAE